MSWKAALLRINKMSEESKRLYFDLIKTTYQGWFDAGDRQYPDKFIDMVRTHTTELVRLVEANSMTKTSAYEESYRFGLMQHSAFYSKDL